MTKDYYKVLGVSRDATEEEITHAFHKLARKYHPDRPGGNPERFKEISEAYRVLSNKERRNQYDRFGHIFEGEGGFEGSGSQFWQDWRGFGFQDEEGMGFDEIFSDLFGFETFREKRTSRKGKSITVDVELDLEETLYGKDKEISIQRYVTCAVCRGRGAELGSSITECKVCRGTGRVQELRKIPFGTITRTAPCPECQGEEKIIEKPCSECQGEGRIKRIEKLKVRIPAGAVSGEEIQYQGMGDVGRRGAPAGELFVRIFVREHPLFTREGDNVFIKVPVSFSQMVLGDKIEVQTLEGPVMLKISAGIDPGRVIRLKGKGIPRSSGYGRGDQLVEIVLKTPKNLTKEQEDLIKKIKNLGL